MRTSTTSVGSPQKTGAQSPSKALNFSVSSMASPSRQNSKSMNMSNGFSTATHAMKCGNPGHQQKNIQWVCLQKDCQFETRMVCSKCLQGNHNSHTANMVKIQEIFDNVDDSQIFNWPIEDAGKAIKQYLSTETGYMTGLYKDLEQFFSDLEEQLTKRLETLKKSLLLDINTYYLRGDGKEKMLFLTTLRKMYAEAYDFGDLQQVVKQFYNREVTSDTFHTNMAYLLADQEKALQQKKVLTYFSKNAQSAQAVESAQIDKDALKQIQKNLFDSITRFKSCISVATMHTSTLPDDTPCLPRLTTSYSAPNGTPTSTITIQKGDDWSQQNQQILDYMNLSSQNFSDRDCLQFKRENYADNSKYVGFLLNGQRHLIGTRYYSDGNVYVGQWERQRVVTQFQLHYIAQNRGVKQGLGIMHFRQGTAYQGDWLKDKKHGAGTEFYPNGSQFEGKLAHLFAISHIQLKGIFEDGLKQGIGKFVEANGKAFEGVYVKDKRNGIGKVIYKNGNIEQVYYVMGEKASEEGYEQYLQKGGYTTMSQMKNQTQNGNEDSYQQNNNFNGLLNSNNTTTNVQSS